MNGMQQAQVASIVAASITLAATSGQIPFEPSLALLAAAAGLALLLGVRVGAEPRFALVANTPHPSPRGYQGAVFLREGRSDSTGDGDDDPASRNGRRADDAEPDEPLDDAEHSAALSYEEFTARVAEEVETEEISFLPPYASGAESAAPAEQGSASGPWNIDEVGDPESPAAGSRSKMPMPRHFALGTVAVIRKLLEPREVERILAEQRRYPRLRFGDIAVQLGLLTEPQLQEVLLAQQQGAFTDAEIREARDRLRAFKEETGAASKR